MSYDEQELSSLAQEQGMRVGVIHSDQGAPAVLIEADNGGTDVADLDKAVTAGQVQAHIGGRV